MSKAIRRLKQKIKSLRYRYVDEFVFIHINKTGGSSIAEALGIPFEHKTVKEKIGELGQRKWDKKYTFTVIRNPWDKVVSHYHFRVQTNQTRLGDISLDFNEWVKRSYGGQDTFYYDNPKMFMPQMNWITDGDDQILVDEIIHFENFSAEFHELAKRLGKEVNLPHMKSSKRDSYQSYYDEDTIDLIGNWFARDIQRFGYRF